VTLTKTVPRFEHLTTTSVRMRKKNSITLKGTVTSEQWSH